MALAQSPAQGQAPATLDGAYPPPPVSAPMLVEPAPPLPAWRMVAAPSLIAIGLGSIVGSLVLRSAAKARGEEIELAEAGFGGAWPRELSEEREKQVAGIDSLQSEKDRYESLFYPALLGGALACLVGTLLLVRRPAHSEFRLSLGRASLGGQF